MAADQTSKLVDLLNQAASAHHEYETEELGEHDPEWPEWYAEWLVDHGIGEIVQPVPQAASLANAIVSAEKVYEREDPDEPWQEFYARFILGEYEDDE